MVRASTMTLVMAEKDPPVFRDFLGIGRKDECASRHPQASSGFLKRSNTGLEGEGEAETSARASPENSGRFETLSAPGHVTPSGGMGLPSSEPGSDGWQRARAGALQHHGVKSAFHKPESENRPVKRRESPAGRESLQERLQMSVEALENSRPLKAARVEQKDEKKAKFRNAASNMDELRLSMQPPRPSKGPGTLQTNASKVELSSRIPGKPERLRGSSMNVGISTPARVSHLSMLSEKSSAQITIENTLARENAGLPPMLAPPAADEGSRTGIKGSGLLASLQQSTPPAQGCGMSSGPSPPPRRPKVSSHSAGSDSLLPSRHQFSTPQSRQLTIFYGGQAHVFDDVPPDKASQIMQLAGSNGRSWSTTYSPRQSTMANSASEGSLSAMEREREKPLNLSKGAPVSGGNLALSPDVQTLLRGLAQSGAGRSAQGPSLSDAVAPSSTEMQLSASDRTAANEMRKDTSERRALARPTPCTEDSAKEALLRGQHWM